MRIFVKCKGMLDLNLNNVIIYRNVKQKEETSMLHITHTHTDADLIQMLLVL